MVVVPERQSTTTVTGAAGTSAGEVALTPGEGDAAETAAPEASAAAGSGAEGARVGGASEPASAASAGTPVNGSTAGAATAGRIATAAAGPSAAACAGGATARGVTKDKIRIGIAQPDIEALKSLGPRFNQGDIPQQVASVYEAWKREGKVPVCGRDIEFVFRKYAILVNEDARAACVDLVQQQKVFMVVAPYVFSVGSECVAVENQTPLVTTDEISEDVYKRGNLMFGEYPATERSYRNLPHWAHAEGLLQGKKLGLYAGPALKDALAKHFIPQLTKLGYKLEVIAEGTSTGQAGPESAVAVQRMKSAGVEVVFFLGDGGFPDQAEAQGYKPQYIRFPNQMGTGDTSNSSPNQAQWDGTTGFAYMRHGERGTPIPFEPPTEKCLADFERKSGKKIPRTGVLPNAEEASLLQVCDSLNMALQGLTNAGATLTNPTFVGGMERIRNMQMAAASPVSFGRGKHDGVSGLRSWRWDSKCVCGKIVGNPAFRPFYVL